MPSLRRKLEQSAVVHRVLAAPVGAWLRLSLATIKWQAEGEAEVQEALTKGPIILVGWHECLLLTPAFITRQGGTWTSLRDPSFAGSLGAVLQESFGMSNLAIREGDGALTATREALKRIKAGHSIGIAGDGPLGPAKQLGPAALDWARLTGLPIFAFSWASQRHRRAGSWDKMMLPGIGGKGAYGFAKWDRALTRKADATEKQADADDLAAFLSANERRIHARAGL